MSQTIRVALPVGIGDSHWSIQKLRSLKARHPGCRLSCHINESPNHQTVHYLRMFDFIDEAHLDKKAPIDIDRQMPGGPRDDRWAKLEGCQGWGGFDYLLVANGWIERGRHLGDWIPELETDYDFSEMIRFPGLAESTARHIMRKPRVVLYPSGVGPNAGFHKGWWAPQHWLQVIRILNEAGERPVIIGANTPDDKDYWFKHLLPILVDDRRDVHCIVGETSIPEVLAVIKASKCWCGLNSGTGIVSASMGVPTVMLWSDNRFKVGAPHLNFDPGMQRSWLSPEQLATYRTHSYGDPATTPEAVAASILEVMR